MAKAVYPYEPTADGQLGLVKGDTYTRASATLRLLAQLERLQ